MLNRLKSIANPVVVFALICVFVYIYFFHLRGEAIFSSVFSLQKADKEWDEIPLRDPNIVALAGAANRQQAALGQPENPVNPPAMPNIVQQPNIIDTLRANTNPEVILPSQPNQNSPLQPIPVPDLMLVEGHWIGLEVIPLTPAIAEANMIPPDVSGVLIDEVTMLAAAAGFFAGDVIASINGKKVNDLKSFRLATRDVAQYNKATVSVFSSGRYKEIVVLSTEALGVAQMEGAPMILPTSRSPHGRLGPCDKCHAIAKGGMPSGVKQSKNALNPNELLKDQGDALTKVAPNIRKGTPPPHGNRGTCTSCHTVL